MIEPMVLKVLEERRFPGIVSDTDLEDTIRNRDDFKVPERIDAARIRHCIARTLKVAGYEKRSSRGHTWDYETFRKIDNRPVETHKTLRHRIKDLFFPEPVLVVDTHPVRKRNRKPPVHTVPPKQSQLPFI